MSPRSALHNSVSYRSAGALLVISGLLLMVGQITGMVKWHGMYSLIDNRPSDLGATVCGVLRDDSGTRFVCNPAHTFTTVSVAVSGLLVVGGAVLMIAAARRIGDRGVFGPASLLALSGVLTIISALVRVDDHPTFHDIVLLGYLLSMWAALEVLVDSATRHAEETGDAHPLIYGAYLPVTRVIEFFSVVGTLTLIFSGRDVMPGAFERMAFDTLTVWIVVFGLGLVSLGGAADRERLRVAEMEKVHRRSTQTSAAAAAGFGRTENEEEAR